MSKPHFFETPDPVKFGKETIALCGAVVANAFIVLFSADPRVLTFSLSGFCRKCGEKLGSISGRHLLYGILDGEVAKIKGLDRSEQEL